MKTKRRRLIEKLEHRIVLDGVGTNEPPQRPAWESVIVSLQDNVANPGAVARGLVKAQGGQLGHVYEHAIKGFSAQLPPAAVQALAGNPQVKLIEPDLAMQAYVQETPNGVLRIDTDTNLVAKINGIDERVDVDIAIIDSGIDADHPDLNVAGGYNATNGPTSNWSDGYGHGTHVAGTAAALDNDFGVVGVAPGARLWAVKVLGNNGSGRLSNVIEGIDWVTANANTIEVANMSLGGQGVSNAYRTAIQNSVAQGVVYIVAAGNDYADILGADFQFGTADDTIPAAYPEVATISAMADTDGQAGGNGPATIFADFFGNYQDDEFADFSNFSNSDANNQSWYDSNNVVSSDGLGIDLMLPGVDIMSTYKGGGYALNSGTSMAAPHAAGLAALYIAANGRATDAAGVYAIRQALIDGGKGWTSEEGLALPTLGDSPDKHTENLGWAGSTADLTDIAVAGIVAPASVVVGSVVNVEVTIANTGNQNVSSDIVVSLSEAPDAATFTDQTISGGLLAGATTTLTFSWDTSSASLGSHTLTANHNFADDQPSNDSSNASVTVEAAITDIAVLAVNAPSSVTQGDLVSVDVIVENSGNQAVTSDILVSLVEIPDAASFSDQTISGGLNVGASTTLTYLWDTGSATLGEHTLTASHNFIDDNNTNDSNGTTVDVVQASTLTVDSITPASVTVGGSVNVVISGGGFESGANVELLNGEGKQPTVSNINVVDTSTITATISTRNGGPPRDRFWDVVVTNPGGSSAVLVAGFTVTVAAGNGATSAFQTGPRMDSTSISRATSRPVVTDAEFKSYRTSIPVPDAGSLIRDSSRQTLIGQQADEAEAAGSSWAESVDVLFSDDELAGLGPLL